VAPSPDPDPLARAEAHAREWLASLPDRRVPAQGTIEDARERFGSELPETGAPPADVVDRLAAAAGPGLMASASGRFFGWVMGGTLPAALAADWLVSAWDQNAGMRASTPGVVAAEEIAGEWLLELLGLPAGSAVGFPTGATLANVTCLAAARDSVLAAAGWDITQGLAGGPRIRVLAGEERHGSVDLALRYLGLGLPETVAVDSQGRLDPDDLARRLDRQAGQAIVCLQAGNIHSGAFDPFGPAIDAASDAGAWVHVDGAFGLWAAATPTLRQLTQGMARADSWATDAHKTLNTPYDGGIAVVRDPATVRAAMGLHASYLLASTEREPYEYVPELSRRARGVPVWAALASLGAAGVRGLVEGLVGAAQAIADGVRRIPGATVINDVVYTQVCVAFEDDARTRAVLARILEDGAILPSGSTWHDRAVIRFSVSNHATGEAEVAETVEAVRRAASVP
jgi:glutamate/tyrosine decarboxylase-like PLP-dependent enzyme